MSERVRGFPTRFPVRDDGKRAMRYRIVSAVSRMALRTVFGSSLDARAMAEIPTSGPLLMACNHLSNIDPFIFGAFGPGAMFCMAKKEPYANSLVAWVLGGCNCFPVDRGAPDRWALRTSLGVLERGGRLLVFVEGTRAARPGMQRAEPGVGFLARKSGAPVLPIAIWGSERALGRDRRRPRRVPIHVVVGEVFTPQAAGGHGADQQVADEIGRRVAELMPPEYRGAYG